MHRLIGFSAEYIEKLTPAERSLYWLYYQQDLKENNAKKTNSVENDITNE